MPSLQRALVATVLGFALALVGAPSTWAEKSGEHIVRVATDQERQELLAYVDDLESRFAQTLDVSAIAATDFVEPPASLQDEDDYADLGEHGAALLRDDLDRRARFTRAMARLFMTSQLFYLSAGPLDGEDEESIDVPPHFTALMTRADRIKESIDESRSPEEAVRRLDRFLDLTEMAVRELAMHVPRNARDRDVFRANLATLEFDGFLRAKLEREDSEVQLYSVARGLLHFLIIRTPDGLRVVSVGLIEV